ncbi:MAG: HU family DNA-binding protein [Bacteroidales bacterium]|jgi:predicted histone-like DNA-binding protein|nr:HU family DNA-binding protein [Bacteroidales bacterium]
MSIKYKLVRREDYLNPEGKKKGGYYPQVVRKATLDLQSLSKRAADGTTFNAMEVEVALRMAMKQIEEELLNSNHVCLDGFGTFSLSAESRRVENPDDIRAESIAVKRVVFVPSKILMQRIKKAKFKRAQG